MAKILIDVEALDVFLEECTKHFISKKTLDDVNELLLEIDEESIKFDVEKLGE